MKLLVILIAAAVSVFAAAAQTRGSGASAASSYHSGAQLFINGETERASSVVDAALAKSPDDARLKALRDLINQQQEQDQSQEHNQSDDQDSGDEGESGDSGQESPGNDGQGPQPPERNEAERDQTANRQQNEGGEDQTEGNKSGDRSPNASQPSQATPQGRMSQAQAQRILDAVAGDERLLLEEMRREPSRVRRNDKDW